MIIYEFEGDQYALCSRRCALLFRWCPSLRALDGPVKLVTVLVWSPT